MIAAFTINGGVKLYGREEKCSDRWADYPIRAMIILLSLIFTSTRLRNICHVLWISEDCQCVLVFSACRWRLLQREQNGLISAKSLFQKILADVRAFPSGGELICILFSHEALPDPWSLQWESLAPLTKASLIVLCSQRLIMFSPVFGLSDRVPLESSTAAGYNGERHLLPTKTRKMEVGSETECE